ncbi:unnamed protein product [Cuscuta epithymum]|uniref:Saposin B-type domain-containing protein n=1 Tax=Cuscuta epithymum TaxID=186058 RepID=A0AAV0G6K3_9ASTE|nr:unnamed protein product [Cuscuta epithymum]
MLKLEDLALWVLLSAAVISSPISVCAKKVMARKEDIPYIKCQVCEMLAYQLYHQVQRKKAAISPKKISEYQIIEISESVCNLKKQEADWILKIDIVEEGDRLALIEQDSEGQCNSECKTVERACQEVMDYSDTDVAEYLYKNNPELDSLLNFLCKDLSKACSRMPPPVPKDRAPGEPFLPKPPKDAELENILKAMQSMPGAPSVEVYSGDELNQNFGDSDDDDEIDLSLDWGKPVKEKQTKELDWKQKISKVITDTGETLKNHIATASYKLSDWWRAKKEQMDKNHKSSSKTEL